MERTVLNKLLATVLIALLAVFSLALLPKASEAYADSGATQVASGTCGGCDWAIELDSSNNGVLTIKPTSGDSGQLASCSYAALWPWNDYRSYIYKVEIEAGVTEGNSIAEMFAYCQNLTDVSFPSGFGSNAANMSKMFEYCEHFNPTAAFPAGFGSNALAMESMFEGCLEFNPAAAFPSGFGSNALIMESMFGGCLEFNPTAAFPSGFGSQATDMSKMFEYCEYFNPTAAFPAGFGSSALAMSSMFEECLKFNPTAAFPDGFGSNALIMYSMFASCMEFNPTAAFPDGFGSKATNMNGMFQSCENFNPTTAFPAGFGSQATDMGYMFDSCSSFTLTNPFPTGFGSQVTNMDSMFAGCIRLVSIDLSTMNTTQVVEGDYVFDTCPSLRMVKVGENWTFNGANESRNSGMNFPDVSVTYLTTGKWICIDGQNEGKVYAASEIPDGAGTYKWETTFTVENKEALEEVLKAYKAQNPNATISVEFVASENDANADDIALIQEQAGDKELFCFDASIVVTIDGQRVTAVNFDIPLVISFSFDCSNVDELTVYRVHDGVVEELTMDATELSEHVTINEETNTITITASKFSTYAFAYKETVPATGDSSSVAIALSLAAMLCASACLIAAHRRKA